MLIRTFELINHVHVLIELILNELKMWYMKERNLKFKNFLNGIYDNNLW